MTNHTWTCPNCGIVITADTLRERGKLIIKHFEKGC